MKYLLDTHTFLWYDAEPNKLSAKVANICSDKSNTILLSLVSVWEMQIKTQLGKLTLSTPIANIIEQQRITNQIEILPITLSSV